MRKLVVYKRKKKICVGKRRQRRTVLSRAAAWVLAVLMLLSGDRVMAQEEAEALFTKEVPVYHVHCGNEKEGGLCYNLPVYHVHEGDEEGGGACYQTPVYHVHEGNETDGGLCYQTPVYHTHEGDEKDGGVCYSAVYHKHKTSCYEWKESSELGCYILRMEDTSYDDYEGHDFRDYYMSCGDVVHGINSAHTHQTLICNREGKIDKYKITCTLTSNTVVGYLFDCTKTEETIDRYELSCEKTADYIEKYERSCGRSEEIAVAQMAISAYLSKAKDAVTMYAAVLDLSEGELFTGEPVFCWYDGAGNQIGTGERLQVKTNGTYYVELSVENEDIRKDNLKTKLEISAIPKKEKPTKAPQEKPTPTPGKTENTPVPESKPTSAPQGTPIPVPVETKAPLPTETPKETQEPGSVLPPENPPAQKPQATTSTGEPVRKVAPLYGEESNRPTPAPVIQTDTVENKPEIKHSEPEPVTEKPITIEKKAKPSFFEQPVVKVVTITTSTLLGLCGLFLLVWLWRFMILVYNDDGKGNLLLLSVCVLRRRKEGYLLQITDRISEKAVTNRYCLKSLGFHLWRKEEEELFIVCGKQKRTVKIQKEMLVVL